MSLRAAVIKNSKVDNVIIIAKEEDAELFNAVVLTEETAGVSAGWGYDEANKTFIAPPPPPPKEMTVLDLEEEVYIRLSAGVDFDFGDERGIHTFATTIPDMRGWDEVNTIANLHINKGNSSATINIVTDTGPVVVKADEWQDVFLAIHEFRQHVWSKSFALREMDPFPQDFKDDKYWT